jgi:ferredoxin
MLNTETLPAEPSGAEETGKAHRAGSARRHRACRGEAALWLTERMFCGNGAVSSAAAAEGISRSGARAARLLSGEETHPVAAASAPWVLHRTTEERGRCRAFGAFELSAGNAQEAVDHCLVAHLTGVAGELLVEQAFAEQLWLFEAIDPGLVAKLDEATTAREQAVADEAGLSRALGRAFELTKRETGREVAALSVEIPADAEHVIVTSGDARAHAKLLAEALGLADARCGVVGVMQMRPFPADALAELLRGRRSVLVAEPGWARGRLEAGVRAALGDAQAPLVVDPFLPSALDAVKRALGLAGDGARPAPVEVPSMVALGVAPPSARGEALLADTVARLAEAGRFEVAFPETRRDGVSVVLLGERRPHMPIEPALDVLFVAHPLLFDAHKLGKRMRQGGALIVASAAPSARAMWAELGALEREVILERRLTVWWLDSSALSRREAKNPSAPWVGLENALILGSCGALVERLGVEERRLRALAGGNELGVVDTSWPVASVAPSRASALPTMPRELDTGPSGEWQSALRRFHLTGEGAAGPAALVPLAPAAVSGLLQEAGAFDAFPLVLFAEPGVHAIPLQALARETLGALDAAGSPSTVVAEHLPRLLGAVARTLSGSAARRPLGPVLDAACARFAGEFELSAAARKGFDEELARFTASLPRDGTIFGLTPEVHLEFYAACVLTERRRRTAAFVAEAARLAAGLTELLRLEASREARSPDELAAVLGESTEWFDTDALASALSAPRGPRPLEEARRRRVASALSTLQRFVARAGTATELVVVHPGIVPDRVDLGRVERVRHGECFELAAGLFDGLARALVEVLRAERVARLELDGRYDSGLHDEALARLDWHGLGPEELLLVPPVLVVESAERVWHSSLDGLSRLLRSGRPIHVLVEECTLSGAPPGLGNLLVAHREALVLAESFARPAKLVQDFTRMALALRPAVAIVETRRAEGPMPAWLWHRAALEGRAAPAFRYDPDAGSSWAECFDIDGNPQRERAWPARRLEIQTAAGDRQWLDVPFTFADAAALSLAFRSHFWLVPSEAWSDEQMELGAYLDALGRGLPDRVPFIWVIGEDDQLARAVVTRELAFACRERLRLWHGIQELGGSDNEHARRAAQAARAEALAEAEERRAELVREHGQELARVKKEEAAEALNRLARVLLDPDAALATAAPVPRAATVAESPGVFATGAFATVPSPPPTPTMVVAAQPAPEQEEESVSFSDPYIDTVLCTSCNECTNLNPLMFKYNADKQAVLADPKAGTFLQLVVAAEKCPASCIHPGAPRAGDETASDELVSRAARFNGG